MEKKIKSKLKLPSSEKVIEISAARRNQIKGGAFLSIGCSIGYKCSIKMKCRRLWTKCWGGTEDLPCEHDSLTDP